MSIVFKAALMQTYCEGKCPQLSPIHQTLTIRFTYKPKVNKVFHVFFLIVESDLTAILLLSINER